MQTPLAQLMELTRITAKQISDNTGINVTLLSKFKNNQRELNYASKYPSMLAEFFLQNDIERATQAVHRFLTAKDASLAEAPFSKYKEALCLWLTNNEPKDKFINSSAPAAGVFYDVNGLQKYLQTFTEQVLAETPGEITVIHDFPDEETFYTSLLEVSLPYLSQMRAHGCSIRISDSCKMPKTYMTIHNWMDSYFSDQIHLYRKLNPAGLKRMVFLLDKRYALVILGLEGSETTFLSTFYRNDDTVAFFQKSASASFVNTSSIIEKVPFRSIMEFLQILDRALTNRGNTYLVNPVMMYKTMNKEILSGVLNDNGIPAEKHHFAFETNRFTAYLRTKCPYKQIYNLDAMIELANQDEFIDEELSALYGRDMKVSKKHLHDHIRFLTQLNSSDYQILFIPFKNMHLLPSSVSYVVQDDGIFLAWDASRSESRIYSRDTSVMRAAYDYMEEIWNSIPYEFTTPEWQKEQIQNLLNLTSED